jgi:hypothetical protein
MAGMELQIIQNRIHEIRGCRVMLDFDLAELYQVETGMLKRAVKRNIERFPDDFMFELSPKEFEILRCQFGTSSWGGTRYMPFAFTEQGVAMLSSVLKSPTAIEVNISIMRAFVAMRQLTAFSADLQKLAQENSEIRLLLEEFIAETEGKFDDVYVALSELSMRNQKQAEKPRNPIGYKR